MSQEVDLGSTPMAVEQGDGALASDSSLERNTNRFVGALVESQEVHFITGSSYEGTWDALGMAGVGRYVLPNGTIYEGEIRDGMFHGQGSFYWTGNRRLDVVHIRGELKEYKYQFPDDLNYEDINGEYCKFPDRRFHESMKKGLKPGGRTLKTARPTAKVLPAGCYDTGDGVFYPKTQRITSYDDSKEVLRIPSAEEYSWILEKCRKSWSEPTGYRAELNENWAENPPNLPYNLPMSQDSPDRWWKRLTTFAKDPDFLAGRNEKDASSFGLNDGTVSIPKVCICDGTVLIGEPCRCILCSSGYEQGEYGESRSGEMYKNQCERFEWSSSEMHVNSASNARADIPEDLNAEKSLIKFRNDKKSMKSIQTLKMGEPEYRTKDESQTNELVGRSQTNIESRSIRNDFGKSTTNEKSDGRPLKENRKRDDDPSMSTVDMDKHLKKSSAEKSFSKKKLDSSTELKPSEKVSRVRLPEVNEFRTLDMKLLPENLSQKNRERMTIESERGLPGNRETGNSVEFVGPTIDEHSHVSRDKLNLESPTIDEELSGKKELKDEKPDNLVELLVDNKHSSGEAKTGYFATNTSENAQPANFSRSHSIQNRQSVIEADGKIKDRESSTVKTDAKKKLKNVFNDKTPLTSRGTSTEKMISVSPANGDSKYSANGISDVGLGRSRSTHHEEPPLASKVGISELDDLEKPRSTKPESESESTDDNNVRSDSEKHLKIFISSGSETNEEVSKASEIIPEEKSFVILSSRNVENSSSAGFSSKWDEGSSVSSREDLTSLDKVHPSLATLKSKKQEFSKDQRLLEIYKKHSNTKKSTDEPVKSTVWRLSSANFNYGPETKIKNLLFHPALTAPRSENVVYVRKPCDHRACTTSIREVRATASRTGKEYPSNIPTKTSSSHSNVKEKK
ncbi:uncharacterized protein [Venturia canescens]|uniref:uncharacterized protein n=1 Tax=Venturia canescens TaxID=32260 RepID=UPI001C9D3AFF|nr:uncharacterized protein LOC122411655 [Venturia canescens]